MSEFEEKARAYCKARVEFLDLRKKLRTHFDSCGIEGYQGEDHFLPCWHGESDVYDSQGDWCDSCEPHYVDFHRRHELSQRFSALMRSMLQAYRRGEES